MTTKVNQSMQGISTVENYISTAEVSLAKYT
jgi:hypothetical protein